MTLHRAKINTRQCVIVRWNENDQTPESQYFMGPPLPAFRSCLFQLHTAPAGYLRLSSCWKVLCPGLKSSETSHWGFIHHCPVFSSIHLPINSNQFPRP
ncbi:hypothetical protein ATANTOWER_000867 [Ataeniobius toweri]|uniref:Uncharacterized protein n=1 Tax=Ataeniobius toweri TaxID=208326 RepID=A0ABU7ALE2_9TELE|nr:hypothetical protein [Ataeniobius toweri]